MPEDESKVERERKEGDRALRPQKPVRFIKGGRGERRELYTI